MSRPSVSKLPLKTGRRSRSLSRPTNIGKPNIATSRDQRAVYQTPKLSVPRTSYRSSSVSINSEGSVQYRSVSQTPRLTPNRSRSMEKRMKKKDTRPINDKAWQGKQVAKTQQYLLERGACSLLNNEKNLRPLTLKMFVQIFNYLVEPILTNYEDLTVKNYVERLPAMLGTLMYPGVVSASVLKTANTMHSWPTILAILSWLVDLHRMACDEDEQEEEEEEASGTEDVIQQIVSKAEQEAYVAFMKGEPTDHVEKWVSKEFARIFNLPDNVEEYVEKLNSNVEKLCKEREEIDNRIKSEVDVVENQLMVSEKTLAELREVCENNEQKIKQLHDCEKEKIEHTEKLKKNVEQLEAKLEELKSSGLVTWEMRYELKNKIDAMKAEKKLRLEMIEYKEKLSYEIDIELSELNAVLLDKIKTHNLALVKPSLKYPEIEELFIPSDCVARSNMLDLLSDTFVKKEELTKKRLQTNKLLDQELKAILEQLQQAQSTAKNNNKEIEMVKKMKSAKEQELEELKHCFEKESQQYLENIARDKEKCIETTNSMSGLDKDKEIRDNLVKKHEEWQQKLPSLAKKMVNFFEEVQMANNNQINQLNNLMDDLSTQWRKEIEILQ